MGTRNSSVVNRAFLAVLWVGMAAFVVLHSLLIFDSGTEQTRSLIRVAWFVGLGIIAATVVYFVVLDDSTGARGRE